MFDVQSKRGSIWHRWDPHIHTSGTALNDQYAGPDPSAAFLDAIEARIGAAAGSLAKLSFSVCRNMDPAQWAAKGEHLSDLWTNGPFKRRGE